VLYTTGSWSIVYALDAKTGKQLWQYDPQVPQHFGTRACCDVVNRGVAFYQDKVYVGTLDGRLLALDAQSGKPVWSVVTVDQEQAYTITGAPRVVKGKGHHRQRWRRIRRARLRLGLRRGHGASWPGVLHSARRPVEAV
jgi:glucose dehydrogenase